MITKWKKVKWFFKKPRKVTNDDMQTAEQHYTEIFKEWCGSDSTAAFNALEPKLDEAARMRTYVAKRYHLWQEYCKWKGLDYD